MAATGPEPVDVCPRCGFHAEQLIPADAAVAARSLARRWGELLTRVAASRDAAALLNRRLPSGTTVVERAAAIASAFERHANELRQVWAHDGVELGDAPPPAVSAPVDVATLARRLHDAGEQLAAAIERYHPFQWDHAGRRGGQAIGALELAREAVHEASHWLRIGTDEIEALLPSDEEADDRW
jgi:hypothetical protein